MLRLSWAVTICFFLAWAKDVHIELLLKTIPISYHGEDVDDVVAEKAVIEVTKAVLRSLL